MSNIPVSIDPTSTKQREVTVVVYVDGKPYETYTNQVQEFAIPFVVSAAIVQVDDPDYDAAADHARDAGDPLPPGW